MNYFVIIMLVAVSVLGVFLVNDSVYAQTNLVEDMEFIQTGIIYTEDHSFHISNDLSIHEFFNGNIIRISGQIIEGFPYIVYSLVHENEDWIDNSVIKTRGMIFVNGEFTDLLFMEKTDLQENNSTDDKDDNIVILTKYTQRVYSKQVAQIEIKIYDKEQNKLNNFSQNYGQISDVNVSVKITNDENQTIHFSEGTTNKFGFFETELLIPDNSKRESLTVEIIAENDNSKASKILQIFSLGARPQNNS